MTYSDDDILEAILQGSDDQAIAYFYADFWPEVKKHIMSKGGSTKDAEEVYHHAIMKFFERIKNNGYKTGNQNGIRGYIYTICKNRWLDQLKDEQRQIEISDTHREKHHNDFANDHASAETKDFMKQLFEQLGERCENILDYGSM